MVNGRRGEERRGEERRGEERRGEERRGEERRGEERRGEERRGDEDRTHYRLNRCSTSQMAGSCHRYGSGRPIVDRLGLLDLP